MTEEEWATSKDRDALLKAVRRDGGYNRKSRLFARACHWAVGEHIGSAHVRVTVAAAEERADHRLPQRELERSRHHNEHAMPGTSDFLLQVSLRSLTADKCNASLIAYWLVYAFSQPLSTVLPAEELHDGQLARLRDIFENPFRSVAFSPEWRTDTAVSLARDVRIA